MSQSRVSPKRSESSTTLPPWPQIWPDQNNYLSIFCRTCRGLSNAVYRLSLSFLVFEFCPPAVRRWLRPNIGKWTTGPHWDVVALVKTVLCQKGSTLPLKVVIVCHLALAIWSYWHGCRERIFLNISNASNPTEAWKPPKFLTFRCPQYEICPDGLSTRPQHHFSAL